MFDTQFGSGFLGSYLLSLTDPKFRACDKRGVSVLLKSAINRCCNLVLTSAFIVLLVSCGFGPKFLPDVDIKTVDIVAASDANQGFPVAVDVVILNDKALIATVEGLSGNEWFKGRKQFSIDHPKNSVIISREVVPGKRAPTIELKRSIRVDAKAVFIFANFIEEGINRLRVDSIEEVKVALTATNLSLATK